MIFTSLAAAIGGTGIVFLMTFGFYGSLATLAAHGVSAMLTVAILLLAVAFAGFFVYRHTARRRKLQTAIAVLLTLVLTGAAFVLGALWTPDLRLSRAPATRGSK